MSTMNLIFGITGGLGLFLFGMNLMSDGIKALAGSKLKLLLTALTRHRMIAVLLGVLATILVQSSSATTVMIVGFVNAGLLPLKQALCVVLGANVGTTVTAWMVSIFGFAGFKITAYALPFVGIGFFLHILARKPTKKHIGLIMLGFGMLFIGVNFMQEMFSPIKDSPRAQEFLIQLSNYPLLTVLAGTVLTILLQSSSASIMVIQVLALQGAFGTDWPVVLRLVIPFILGDNIGTTVTAQLAAVRASRAAKRAAMGHTIFNCIGVCYILPIAWMGTFADFVRWITPWSLSQQTIMADMAAANTVINVLNTLIFLPMIGLLETLVTRIIPISPLEAEEKPVTLDDHLLETPAIAFEQLTREMQRMVKIARKAAKRAITGLILDDEKCLKAARRKEEQTDEFQYEMTTYLSKLARQPLAKNYSDEIPVLLHTINDLERIGDLAVNIVEVAERKLAQNIVFTEDSFGEANELLDCLLEMFGHVRTALKTGSKTECTEALVDEQRLNAMQIGLRKEHIRRISENHCSAEAGLIFIDLVDNVERIGDHLTNIAQSIMGGLQWEYHERKQKPAAQPIPAKPAPLPPTPASEPVENDAL